MVRALWLVRQSERTYFSHSHYCPDEPHGILAISALARLRHADFPRESPLIGEDWK